MENASKALIMAAGVLIALLILSLAVYLVATFGSFSAEVHKQNEQNEIQAFNSQFLAYQGEETVTIHDIVTIINYAKDNNRKYELNSANANNESTYYVTVTLFADKTVETQKKEYLDKYIKKYSIGKIEGDTADMPRYNCNVKISPVTGRVYQVIFTENK